MSKPEEIKEKREEVMRLLKELEQKTDLEATAVVTKDGIRLACSVSAEMDADIFSAAAAAMVNLGSMTIRRLRQGELKEVIIKGDEGYTIVTEAGPTTMLVAAGRQSYRLGYYLGVLKKYAKDIAEILSGLEAPVEEIAEAAQPTLEEGGQPVNIIGEGEQIGEREKATVNIEKVDANKKISEITEEEKSAFESERKAILEALKALGWEESSSE
ncbi:MAG: roadblock/LC7 domain-containing protein [Candidatus Odinarchaeum yellowstonii]|jgi:predicted regulator of Ras-like GTPase activity (Roadblock/LC7/MglB family)|uniref:Roadblock/LC7 domain-containing protein n=1 Tax=Odinarchaeota yellowstonii (strain LCB_4) TaxID=1841599 RepID=A0AAF0D2N7_ODILC|nr:MAG: roadblock/LC7 domain-containing protein [Candidatus Odinarchaeum yellowstonii]